MPLPAFPSRARRRLLGLLALVYGAASALHRRLWLRPPPGPPPALPLWIIGSLRAGGAGKTPVVLELAKRLAARGARVGILAYRIGKPRARDDASGRGSDDLFEVFPDSDWRDASDEAVLLARESGARVFVTRRRDRAWRALAASEAFDVLLSDDGLMDARLAGAARIVLARPGERPGLFDLLPAGPYRLTASTLAGLRAPDQIGYGPLEGDETPETLGASWGFRREALLPAGLDLEKTYWALCGLGDPAGFRRALERAGVRLAGLSAGPDHGLPDLEAARRAAREAGAAGFLYSAKDAIKLEGRLSPGESAGRVGEKVTFVPETPSLTEALLSSPRTPPSS